jgi:DNA-binding NtrC family response regulator
MVEVLVICAAPPLRHSLLDHVRRAGCQATGVASVDEGRTLCDDQRQPVLVAALEGQPVDEVMHRVRAGWRRAEVVVVGAAPDVGIATAAVRAGAYDYIGFPAEPVRLTQALLGALERATVPRSASGTQVQDRLEDAIFQDPIIRALFAKADRAAAVNSTVLITGESGTGKEVLARRLHRHSARRNRAFVPVNCGGLTESLVETELFGHRKGAFTGAIANSKGLVDEAEGGVLFLDEIGEMPLQLQVHLLRFLDSGEIRPVGTTCVRHADVRVVAATNRCLTSEIRSGRFREDLFFRLSVVSLHLPPLRERPADITPLTYHYVNRAARRFGVPIPEVSEDALETMKRYRWPGNIRELQNAVEQAVVQQSDGVITSAELPQSLHAGPAPAVATNRVAANRSDLVEMLDLHNGNHTEAAAALGISRTTLWRRLRRNDGVAASRQWREALG